MKETADEIDSNYIIFLSPSFRLFIAVVVNI